MTNDTPLESHLEKIAIHLLQEKTNIGYISSVTGLSIDELLALKNKIQT